MKYRWVFFVAFFAWAFAPFAMYGQTVALTEIEKTWLEAHPNIRVGVDTAWRPIEFVENGVHKGFSADYLALLNERLGINMEPVIGLTWNQVLSGIKNDSLDVIACIRPTPSRRGSIDFTRPYLSFPISIFMKQDADIITGLKDLNGKRVGIIENYAEEELLQQNFPEIELVKVNNVVAGLRWVSVDKIDAYVGNVAAGAYAIQREGWFGIAS